MEARRWTADELKIPFASAKRDVGPGEARFAAAIGGTLLGGSGNAYDVKGPNGERYEVKLLDGNAPIRPGAEGRNAVTKLRSVLDKICDDLERLDLDVVRASNENFPVDEFAVFVANEVPPIKKGEISVGRVFGSNDKFGLTDAVEAVNRLKRESSDQHVVALDGEPKTADDSQFARVGAVLGVSADELGIEPIDAILADLKSPAFDDPELLVRAWDSVSASDVFHSNTYLALVDEAGFKIIEPRELDDRLQFIYVTQGLPRFRLTER